MQQYVCVRVVRMDDVDVALFERDWNNTLYFFILNGDEQIYLRYGGRDSVNADSYLNLESLELALAKGLELHQQYRAGELPKKERPQPVHPRQYPLLVERTFAKNQCVECHLIGDFQNQQRELDGTLDKLVHLYRSPDIKTIGIELEVPKGLLVKEAKGAAQEAGMKAGDTILAVNGAKVYTFGDLQYYYDKVDRRATRVPFTVARAGQTPDLTVTLPPRWWLTDTGFRQSTVDPRAYFESRPLTGAEKQERHLKPRSFAGQVNYIDSGANMLHNHELKMGDIIVAVDGVGEDEIANTPELYIKLRKKAGDSVMLDVIRDGKPLKMPLRTYRMGFRK